MCIMGHRVFVVARAAMAFNLAGIAGLGLSQTPTSSTQTQTTVTAIVARTTATVAGALTTTTPQDEFRQKLRQASVADDYLETTGGKAVIFNDLVDTVPARLRRGVTRKQIRPDQRFILTSETISTPIGRQPEGGLSGKLIFCCGGHGWTFDTSTSLWYTQRPLLYNMVEDYGNIDQLNFFADYCFRAGATVIPARPLGRQSIERIVDNSNEPNCGFQGPWQDSTSDIYYGSPRDKVPYRFAIASKDETAVARYRPLIPKSDYYPVYAWARDGADRVNQTYRIVHSGGATEVKVNHRRVGKGWVYIGQYYFDQGRNGYVEITNRADDPADADGKHVVIADAIRFGNGVGDVNRGGGISGFSREEEAARYWAERSLAARALPIYAAIGTNDGSDNVGTPPRLSAYMNREKDGTYFDRIYLGFHSNAAGGRGTVGLFCESPELRPDLQEEWAKTVARQQNDDLATTGALPRMPVPWFVRAKLTDSHIDFGEIRRDYINNEMCATINEVAFHDNSTDTILLRTPLVRDAMGRANYKAVLRFFREHDPRKPNPVILPDPPVILSASALNSSSVLVRWAPPVFNPAGGAAPASYRVCHSQNGFGFDGGKNAGNATSLVMDNIDPDAPHYFRITAVNAGGESAPSRVLGSARPSGAPASALVVSAFTSLNEDQNLTQTAAGNLGWALRPGGDFVRIIPRLMNAGNYSVQAGDAIFDAGRGFDSCAIEAFTSGGAAMAPYRIVVMLFGRQAVDEGLFNEDVRTTLAAYLKNGGNLFLSGSNIARELDDATTRPAKILRQFARKTLHAAFAGGDAGVYTIAGVKDAPLSTATLTLDNGSGGAYNAVLLNELKPMDGSVPLLRYNNMKSAAAAVAYQGRSGRGGAVVFGFPFETILDRAIRADVMDGVLTMFRIPAVKQASSPESKKLQRTKRR